MKDIFVIIDKSQEIVFVNADEQLADEQLTLLENDEIEYAACQLDIASNEYDRYAQDIDRYVEAYCNKYELFTVDLAQIMKCGKDDVISSPEGAIIRLNDIKEGLE